MEFPGIPRLTVLERRGDAWAALVPEHHWVGERHVCLLALDDGRMLWARFTEVDRPASRAVVRPDEPAHLAWLRPGDACAFFDGYYGERAELVLGAPRTWLPVRYVPAAPAPDGKPRVGTWSAVDAGDDAARRVADRATDHEHCSICWGTIGHGGDEIGYVTEQGEWLCRDCRRDWVLPRSIAFVLEAVGGARIPSPKSAP